MPYNLSTRQKVYLPFKRAFDILFSFLAILLLSPLFLIVSIIVLIDTKGFPIFRQRRIGKNDKEFLILKFRTMHKDTPRDVPTHLLEHPERYVTKTGKWLRKMSLDELPQLFNVFVGHMSFIGPRPALWCQEDLIALRDEAGVQRLRPGLSGHAQVHGRDALTIEEKAKLDEEYLHRFNLWFDIKTLFLTFGKALSHKDFIEGGGPSGAQK